MYAVNTELLSFVVLLVLTVFVLVLVVVSCVDCGNQTEYVKLEKEYVESRDPELQKKKQQEKHRMSAWTDAQYYVRSLPKCRVLEEYNVWEIGYRKERANFLVKWESKLYLLSMVTPGENCVFPLNTESGRNTFKQILRSLKHPYIQPIHQVDVLIEQNKVAIISQFSDEGSLRDFMFKSKPTTKFDQKYSAKLAKPQTLSRPEVALFGRQLLEALLFLKESEIPFTHLHSGNVIIHENIARIANIENGLLNIDRQLERLYRQYKKKFPAKFEKVDIESLSFGIVIYEMGTGTILQNISQLEELPKTLPKEVEDVINTILKDPESSLSLHDIAKLPFFANVALKKYEKPTVTFDEKAKKYVAALSSGTKQLRTPSSPQGPKSYITPKAARDRAALNKSTNSSSVTSPVTSPPVSQNLSSLSTSSSISNARSPPVSGVVPPAPVTSNVPPPPSTTSAPPPPARGPPPPPSGGPPPPPPPSVSLPPPQDGRNDLLSSIRGFSGGLKKTVTNDKSKPVL